MPNRHILLIVVYATLILPVSSQSLNFKNFTSRDGLPSSSVYEALQDRNGFMWFATSGGVSRFDGYTFTNYTIEDGLGDNEILGFFEDSFGRIWFRSLNGKVSYYLNGTIYNSQNTPSLKGLENPSLIYSICETSEHEIIITHYSDNFSIYSTDHKAHSFSFGKYDIEAPSFLSTYQYGSGYMVVTPVELLTLDSAVSSIQIKKIGRTVTRSKLINNEFYIAGDNLLLHFNEKEFTPLTTTTGRIIGIFSENDDFTWLCTTKGAVHFSLQTEKQTESYLDDKAVSSVVKDEEGNLWFTTLEDGVYELTNQHLRNYTSENGLSSDNVFSIDKGPNGDIWLGHDTFVLTKIDKAGKISTFKVIEKIPEIFKLETPHIYEVNTDGSEFLISGAPASFYLNGNKATVLNRLNGRCICKWRGYTYFTAGGSGLRTFSLNLVKKYQRDRTLDFEPLDKNQDEKYNIHKFLVDRTTCLWYQEEGKVWAGTDNGLLFITKDSINNYSKLYPVLADRVVAIQQDSLENLYLATDSKGIIILHDSATTQISVQDGLSSNSCHVLQIDNNILWAGTNAGVNKIVLDENYKPKNILTINTTHGIPSNDIHDLLVDDKNVWIGVSGGLSVLDKNITATDYKPPRTYITGLAVNNNVIDTAQNKLSYKQNNLKINFVGLSYRSMGNIPYRYKLVRTGTFSDDESAWQDTKNTSVDFSSLPPGDYAFSVTAQNSSGVWSSPAHYSFTIAPPFWNTWWFDGLSVLTISFISLFTATSIRKARRKKAEERKKLQLAQLKSLRSQMNFHFMSNAFNSLQGLFVSENGVDQYIGKFSKLMRFTLENSDRHLIPLSEELNYLQLYCDIEQLRAGDKFSFKVESDPRIKTQDPLIPALTLQPFVENAIWHGIMPKDHFGTIRLAVLPNDADSYKIIIEDNGIGINTSLAGKAKNGRKSFGTKLVTDRFEVIRQQSKNKFNLTIEDKSDTGQLTGTRVTIILPFHYEEE